MAFVLVKNKLAIIKAAFIVAFFMPFFSYSVVDMTDLVSPKRDVKTIYKCVVKLNVVVSHESQSGALSACQEFVKANYAASTSGTCPADEPSFIIDYGTRLTMTQGTYKPWNWADGSFGGCANDSIIKVTGQVDNGSQSETEECPPNGSPEHIHMVLDTLGQSMCAKSLSNSESCPVTGSGGQIPDLTFSSGSEICFPNPTDPTQKCSYSGIDGMFSHPQGFGESVDCATGETEPQEPEPTPDSDGCISMSNGKKYCPDKAKDNCKTSSSTVGSGGSDYILECNQNCGEFNGVFMCLDEPKDDQMPDENNNCSDDVFRLANPTICTADNTTDKNGDGVVDNTDIVDAINDTNNSQDEVINELNELGDKLENLDENGFETNQLLGSIDDTLGGVKSTLDEISEKLGADGEPIQVTTNTKTAGGLDSIFGDVEMTALTKSIEDKTLEFKTLQTTIRSELDQMVNITPVGGNYSSKSLAISYGTWDVGLARFSEHFKTIGVGILFAFTCLSVFIMLGARD